MGMFDDLIPGQKAGRFDDLIPQKQADPKIGQPEELSWYEKLASAMPDSWGAANIRGSAIGRLAKGASDPGVAIAQMGANALGMGDQANSWIADKEREYQDARKQAGGEGFDPLRAGGAIGISSLAAPMRASGAVQNAALGGGMGLLEPVTNGGASFWLDKAKQGGLGAVGGAIMAPIFGALARIVSPKASINPDVSKLRDAGVNPTVGQTLGGWANTLEEKLQSLPIMGDMISSARRGATEDFNNAILNTATAPIGTSVRGAGHDAVREAGAHLGNAYEQAAANVSHINFADPVFIQRLEQLEQMAQGLTPDLRAKFQATIESEIGRKVSPNGSILGSDIKSVDSVLGKIASDWRAFNASPAEREFGDAVKQLQGLYRERIGIADPAYKTAKDAADEGWRVFVRARDASAAAKNRDGIFTPAQFMGAVASNSDKSKVGQGTAFMQDAANAAQNVLGNKYPDSGTVGRYLINGMAVPGHYATGGASLLGLGAGALAYTRPVQNALVKLIADRPDMAPIVANYLRQLTAAGTVGAVPMLEQGFNGR